MRLVIACVAALMIDQIASAQTTVQLPTLNTFGYSGSVLVPTGGSTSLGGVSRSAMGTSSRRFGGRARGAAFGRAGASAHVTIIDHDAIDRQLRGLPPKGSRATRSTPTRSTTAAATQTKRTPMPDVMDPDAEGKVLVRFARKQFLAGKHASSFNAYQLAIDSLSPRLAELARAEFKRVFPSQQPPLRQPTEKVASRPAKP